MLFSLTAGIDFSASAIEIKTNDVKIDNFALTADDDYFVDSLEPSDAPNGFDGYESAGDNAVYVRSSRAASTTANGTCGSKVKWSLSSSGELTISGSGEMSDFDSSTSAPWYSYRNSIRSVKINSGVTSISLYAFCDLTSLTSVTIADTVTKIGAMAFVECTSLTSITLPNGVNEIPYALFGNCSNLSSLTASGVTKIGDYAFQGTGFTTFTVGKNVSSISGLAFFGVPNLSSFSVQSGNKTFSASNGVLYSDLGKTLFAYPPAKKDSSFTIPSKVTKIGKGAFIKSKNLENVIIPNSVKTLCESAFQESGLTSVTIPNSVTKADDFTFYNSSVQTITFGTGLKSTSYEMFEQCEDLTTINFPSTKFELNARTFGYCYSLESVSLPKTVTSIGNGCFGECTRLETVTTNGITEIPFQAFLNCKSLASITLNGIKTIHRMAFYGCYSLESVTLPKSTQFVHNIAFHQNVDITCKNTKLSKFGYNGLRVLQGISITGQENYTEAYKVLNLVNKERAKEGLKALVMDSSLLDSAMTRAAETSILFSHTRPDSSTIFEMNSKIYGENIAAGQESANEAMTSWMNSEGHRKNILTADYTTIGIGCFKINGTYFWAQNFGIDTAEKASKPSNKNITQTINVAVDEFGEGSISTDIIWGKSEIYKINLEINLPNTNISKNKTTQASVRIVNPAFPSNIKVNDTGFVWSSSNTGITTVNKSGLVKGINSGKAKITLKLGNMSAKKTVKVTDNSLNMKKVKATPKKKKLKVSWGKINKASGYQVQVAKNKKFSKKKIVFDNFTKKKRLTIKGNKITSKKTYYVRVRAYKTIKGTKYYGNWSKVAKVVK